MWLSNFRKISKSIKSITSRLKPYLRWAVLGGTLFFLVKTLKDNWQEVAAIRIDGNGWKTLAIALFITLLAHVWSGWVWTRILRAFNQTVPVLWAMRVYLKTNIAKYLPGNVWHFYGRIVAVTEAGVSPGVATSSVLMEPVLMAIAALLIALIGSPLIGTQRFGAIAYFLAPLVLLAIHPRILNPAMQLAGRIKGKTTDAGNGVRIERYPFWLLMGEIGFLALRGIGFIITLAAIAPASLQNLESLQLPLLISAFSLAWLLGLIVPGAPGGIGVFEATVTGLLNGHFGAGIILSAVAFYRLISVLAEASGALLALLDLSAAWGWIERYTKD